MLAAVAAAWAVDLVPGDRRWRAAPASASWFERAGGGLTLACAGLGVAPDLDLLVHSHRTVTHSAGAVVFVGLFAGALAANAQRPVVRVALMCAAAYGSHLLLDWLGVDNFPPRGIQAWWPLSELWFISGWDVFWQTARHEVLERESVRANLLAIARELELLLPIVVPLWLVRVKALAGLAAEMPRSDHPPQ
jgi:hypothetical protein